MDPSQKLLNLAKKTDLLALTEKYNLTNVKHAMRGFMCLAQRHDAVMPTRLKHATPPSRVKHSITEPTMCIYRERSGSVVECLTRDRRAVGSSLTGVTALWSLSKTHLS